jgi:serine/threonine protein kinase, bacterial
MLSKRLKGIWSGKEYDLLEELGKGENGIVFKALDKDRIVALKLGRDPMEMAREAEMIKRISAQRQAAFGLSLFELDDGYWEGQEVSFYVMPFIEGIPLSKLKLTSGEQAVSIWRRLLTRLDRLHQQGYIFADLKPDHVIFNEKTKDIEFVDGGGITPIGYLVKQHTPLYDRSAWKAGDRKADPQYDLFASLILLLSLLEEPKLTKSFQSMNRSKAFLYDIIRERADLKSCRPYLYGILSGRVAKASDLLMENKVEKEGDLVHTALIGAFLVSCFIFLYSIYLVL